MNLDPNGPDFQGLAGVTDAVPNPNEKQPKTDEFSLTFERELIANWAVRVTGIYSRNFNQYRLIEINRPYEVYNIPITNPDPGPDGRVGSADDPGTFVTYYDYPASLAGRRFAGTMLVNDPRADSNVQDHRSGGHQAALPGLADSTCPIRPRRWTSRSRAAPRTSRQPGALESQHRLQCGQQNVGVDGQGFGCVYLPLRDYRVGELRASDRGAAGSASALYRRPADSIDCDERRAPRHLRLPDTNLLDIRTAKRFSLGGARSLELRVDIFNVMNVNTIKQRVVRSGPDFMRPFTGEAAAANVIILPRIVQLGASFSF